MTTPTQSPSETLPPQSVEQRFRELEAAWLADTYVLSSYTRIVGHPAFRAIVGLGEAVVPFMLTDLEKRPRLWVWALPEITGEDPVAAEDAGNIERMSETWLRWGREKGYRWYSGSSVCFQGFVGPSTASPARPPETLPSQNVKQRFRQLEASWRAETGHLSSYTKRFNHPAFQEIIRLGEPVVPLMLCDLEQQPGLWVWALPVITGANPVADAGAGKIVRMSEAWVRWGRQKGYQW
jgi:hypothetical protein